MPTPISPFVFKGFPDSDWESATPPVLLEAVLSVRKLTGDGFFRIGTLLKKEESLRRESRPEASFGTIYKEREREAQRTARDVFDAFLRIAIPNHAIINASPVAWAYGQTDALLRAEFGSAQSLQEFHKIRLWIKEYCDGEDQTPIPADQSDESWQEYLCRENWRAPVWLRNAASRHFAGDTSVRDNSGEQSVQRLGKEETETLLDGICRWFWSAVEAALENRARQESVNLASQAPLESVTGRDEVDRAAKVLGDWIINQKLQELEKEYKNDQKNKPSEIELSPIANPRVAAIFYTSERLKQYVAAIKGVYKAEIEAGRFANDPELWVSVYRDKIVPILRAKRNSIVGNYALRLLRTGGGENGEKEAIDESQRDLSRFIAQLEQEMASALEHAGRMPPSAKPPVIAHESMESQPMIEQVSADSVQFSKGVREGKTVELLYDQLRRIRRLYRDNGWTASQICKNTGQDLAIAWEWIDRINDQAHKSEFLKISQWEDGDQFIFLQIAALYRYDPHLRREPSWSTVRDWRKAYRGHLQYGTPDGRKPRR